ncbi:MAG: ABC transporter substrate-binding protein [Prevotella sp.]|nr:ABC transporter substrate-binding protein [Prevotella sp.]
MRYIMVSAVLSAIILFSACSSNKKQENKETPAITIGVMPSMDYLPLAVAQREGFFEKQGVKVTIEKFLSANQRDIAFQSGSVDGGVTDYTSAALLKAGGFDMKLTSKCQAPFYIVAGARSGINNLSQLKGKKVAVSQNTVIDFCIDMALADVGLTPDDVEKIEINKIPDRFEMLRNNKIDATGLPNPFALIAASEGSKLLVSMDSLKYTVTGIVFSQNTIDTNSDAIKKIYAAYNDGAAYLNSHTVADIKDILVKDLKFPEPVAEKVTLPKYTNAQPVPVNDKDIQAVVIWLSGKKLLNDSFNVEDLINDLLTQ